MAGEGFGLGGGNGSSFGGTWEDDFGHTLIAHNRNEDCAIHGCALHSPKAKSVANREGWPRLWDNDNRQLLRVCPHEVGHPDEDSINWIAREVNKDAANAASIHPCDGCCIGKHDPNRLPEAAWMAQRLMVRKPTDDEKRMGAMVDSDDLAKAILAGWKDDGNRADLARQAAEVAIERLTESMSMYGQRNPFGKPVAFFGVRKDRSVDMHLDPDIDPGYVIAMLSGVIRELGLQIEGGLWDKPND